MRQPLLSQQILAGVVSSGRPFAQRLEVWQMLLVMRIGTRDHRQERLAQARCETIGIEDVMFGQCRHTGAQLPAGLVELHAQGGGVTAMIELVDALVNPVYPLAVIRDIGDERRRQAERGGTVIRSDGME